MNQRDAYNMTRYKTNAAVWLVNYRQFGNPIYLTRAIAETRLALELHKEILTQRKEVTA